MLWRMSADSLPRRLGVMSSHRTRKPCAIALSPRFPGPLYGTKEFPVAEGPSGAISCRVVSPERRQTGSGNCGNCGNPLCGATPAGRCVDAATLHGGTALLFAE